MELSITKQILRVLKRARRTRCLISYAIDMARISQLRTELQKAQA